MISKVFVASLALSGAFVAADTTSTTTATKTSSDSTPSGCSQDVTVTAQSDLDNLSSCSTFDGDITIEGDLGTAYLNGIKHIKGSLSANNATLLTSLVAPSLTEIDGDFNLASLTILSTLSFPLLDTVGGSVDWVTLPALSSVQFNTGVTSVDSITISDTGLRSLGGFDVSTLNTLNINNNKLIGEVSLGLENVKNLDISFNAQNLDVSLPNLVWAQNITLQDVARISLPSLVAVNNSAGFKNSSITSLVFKNVTSIGGTLAINYNEDLTEVSFPNLATIGGGFQILNNTQLTSIDGFASVKSVGGAIIFNGNFTEADLPSLNLVKGGVDVESKSTNFNCTSWNQAHQNGDIQGDNYVCAAASSKTSVAISATSKAVSAGGSGTATATGTGSGSGSSATHAATSSKASGAASSNYGVEGAVVFGAVVAFAAQLF